MKIHGTFIMSNNVVVVQMAIIYGIIKVNTKMKISNKNYEKGYEAQRFCVT